MTFNQWAAVNHINDTSLRLAFEGVWKAMVEGPTSPSEASSLLTDLVNEFPEERYPEDEDD